jgi:hypothetical protein
MVNSFACRIAYSGITEIQISSILLDRQRVRAQTILRPKLIISIIFHGPGVMHEPGLSAESALLEAVDLKHM